jgi:hypothetical protein
MLSGLNLKLWPLVAKINVICYKSETNTTWDDISFEELKEQKGNFEPWQLLLLYLNGFFYLAEDKTLLFHVKKYSCADRENYYPFYIEFFHEGSWKENYIHNFVTFFLIVNVSKNMLLTSKILLLLSSDWKTCACQQISQNVNHNLPWLVSTY